MKKLSEQFAWSWSDGWLLIALFLAQGAKGASLVDLIAAADMTNHSIPNVDELSSALTKFLRCGLLTITRGKYVLSSRHLPAIRKAYESRGGLFSSGDKGFKWLRRADLAPNAQKRIAISKLQFNAAYGQHSVRMEKSNAPLVGEFAPFVRRS
jgi:hypothetical protein